MIWISIDRKKGKGGWGEEGDIPKPGGVLDDEECPLVDACGDGGC